MTSFTEFMPSRGCSDRPPAPPEGAAVACVHQNDMAAFKQLHEDPAYGTGMF